MLGNVDNTYTLAGFSDEVADGTAEYLVVNGDGSLSTTGIAPAAPLSAMEADMEAASMAAPEPEGTEGFEPAAAAMALPEMPDMDEDASALA